MKKLMMSLIAGSAVLTLFAQVRHSEPQIPVRPTLEEEGSFSMILIPDPQSQIKFAANQPLFELMTAWVAQNIDRLRIRAALFTGDMVEQNDQLTGGDPVHFHNGDQTSRQQWSAVSRALERLDGRIPYIVCQGNHDVGYVAAENRLSMMPQYIYPERNTEIVAHLAAAGLNHENVHTLENAAYEFHDAAWGDLLVIAFEFAPRDEALDWARGLIESEKYRNHRVIVLTHSFLDTDGSRKKGEGYKLTPRKLAAGRLGETGLSFEEHLSGALRPYGDSSEDRHGERCRRSCWDRLPDDFGLSCGPGGRRGAGFPR